MELLPSSFLLREEEWGDGRDGSASEEEELGGGQGRKGNGGADRGTAGINPPS